MLGVVNEVELVVDAVPPVETVYQSMVSPAPGVAEIFTVPVPQRELAIPDGADGIDTIVTLAVSVATQPTALEAAKVKIVVALTDTPDGF